MYSVICPTMHRDPTFSSFLSDLVKHHLISEIIIIDNDPAKRPNQKVFQHSKIIVLEQTENIKVNPAWNLGVAVAKNNLLCIINDDIRIALQIFYRVKSYLDDPNTGMMFLSPGDHPITNQQPLTTGTIDVIPHTTEHLWGAGCWFFINKKNWMDIPNEMPLFYGDNDIYDWNKLNGRQNYMITNVLFNTPYSVTSREFVNEYAEKDRNFYHKYHAERIKNYAI
jgi:hypothetical protein